MCGLAGIIRIGDSESLVQQVEEMIDVQSHRGPDDRGIWTGRCGGSHIAFGHARLAILDLTDGGRQPHLAEEGRYVLIYNGELYNYRELRAELEQEGIEFASQCDTEVVHRALLKWGLDAVSKFNGMWAFAWLDLGNKTLTLSRDRFGIKPLYVFKDEKAVYFSSEIKGILTGTQKKFEINRAVVSRYLHQSLFNAQEETFFSGIEAVPAAHHLIIDLSKPGRIVFDQKSYWSVPLDDPLEPPDERSLSRSIRDVFIDAVNLRMRSDVPVGILLSGGLDSSAIAAAMHQSLRNSSDFHALSAVSDNPEYDEQPFMDTMARHLGCKIHKVPLQFKPEEAFHLLADVTWFNDEPVGSFSNVAHFFMMQQAKKLGVTVILSGQGADELLCGYKKYLGFYLQALFQQGKLGKALTVGSDFFRQGTVLSQFNFQEAKRYLPRAFRLKEPDVRGASLKTDDSLLEMGVQGCDIIERQRLDVHRYSIPALLHWEDRMSMSSSREIRVPFLDYRLVEMLLPLPVEWKLRDGWTKWIFRRAVDDLLPQQINWRKDKQGFINPQSEWLKNELRDQVKSMIEGDMIAGAEGLIDVPVLKEIFDPYCQQPSGKGRIWFRDIFSPIALEIWLNRFQGNLKLGYS